VTPLDLDHQVPQYPCSQIWAQRGDVGGGLVDVRDYALVLGVGSKLVEGDCDRAKGGAYVIV
jgi:hypothetical protein